MPYNGDLVPMGIRQCCAFGAAVYSDHWHELSVLRKILLRMKSWQNYIFLEGH